MGQSKALGTDIEFSETGAEPTFFVNFCTYESMENGNVLISGWMRKGFIARLQYRVIVPAGDLGIMSRQAHHAAAEAHNLLVFMSEFDGKPN